MDSALVDLFGFCDDDNSNNLIKKLPPEVEEGNIEYKVWSNSETIVFVFNFEILLLKLKLIDPTPTRFEHLVTQMKWRLQEGFGEAIYEIGVEDNGSCCGLSEDEMIKSLNTLKL